MATVLLARYRGPMGFWRPVAVKRLHEALARDPAFVSMLLDEARLGSQVRHPLVAEVIDLVTEGSEVCLVMQYVHGSSLRALLEVDSSPVPIPVAVAVLSDALNGLHAAHEARDTRGTLLGVVHRDVSPHNLLVGADGFTRVTDFGIAKAVWRAQTTCDGQLKGKLAYMAPEQLAKGRIDRRADVFGAAVVLWELLRASGCSRRRIPRRFWRGARGCRRGWGVTICRPGSRKRCCAGWPRIRTVDSSPRCKWPKRSSGRAVPPLAPRSRRGWSGSRPRTWPGERRCSTRARRGRSPPASRALGGSRRIRRRFRTRMRRETGLLRVWGPWRRTRSFRARPPRGKPR